MGVPSGVLDAVVLQAVAGGQGLLVGGLVHERSRPRPGTAYRIFGARPIGTAPIWWPSGGCPIGRIEGAIGTIAAIKFEGELLSYALVLMALLFVLPVGLVAVITFWRPAHLLRQIDELADTINSEGFRDIVDDAIMELVKDECLQQPGVANNGT